MLGAPSDRETSRERDAERADTEAGPMAARPEVAADELEARRVLAAVRRALFARPAPEVQVGRFALRRLLGSGAMGVVYEAWDPQLGRSVALKVLRQGAEGLSPEQRARLALEARAMARLQHPDVLTVYEVGEADGQTFVVMELATGGNLRAWLATPRPWTAVALRFLEAGRGLAAAHEAGLVHRDFKPESECPPQTAPLLPSGRILASRGDLRGTVCRAMPRHAAVLATDWQRGRPPAVEATTLRPHASEHRVALSNNGEGMEVRSRAQGHRSWTRKPNQVVPPRSETTLRTRMRLPHFRQRVMSSATPPALPLRLPCKMRAMASGSETTSTTRRLKADRRRW